jgi:hypothetical protein
MRRAQAYASAGSRCPMSPRKGSTGVNWETDATTNISEILMKVIRIAEGYTVGSWPACKIGRKESTGSLTLWRAGKGIISRGYCHFGEEHDCIWRRFLTSMLLPVIRIGTLELILSDAIPRAGRKAAMGRSAGNVLGTKNAFDGEAKAAARAATKAGRMLR